MVLFNSPQYLTQGEESGSFKISIPWEASYILVLNDTLANIAVSIGDQLSQTADAQIWTPGSYMSLPLIEGTKKVSVFWSSQSPIAIEENLVQFYFSDQPIQVSGGEYGASGPSSTVQVENTITAQFATPQNVNVETMPILTATDGTNTHQLKSDTNGNLYVNVVNPGGAASNVVVTSALPAGNNNIGEVNVAELPSLPSGSNNIGHVNIDNGITISAMPPVEVSSQPIRASHKYYEGAIGLQEVIFDMSTTPEGNADEIIYISNDDTTNDLYVSFDGTTATSSPSSGENGVIHLKPGEVLNNMPRQCTSVHFIRSAAGGNVRFLGV